MALALALALLLPARAAEKTPEGSVKAVFQEVERLQAEQDNQDARRVAWLDHQCQLLSPEVLRWGWRTVAPLSEVLADRSRGLKTRLLAASLLGLTADPGALTPLSTLLRNPDEPSPLRSSAAESLPGLGVSKAALRRALCPLLAEKDIPQDVLAPVLINLEPLGCDEPALLENLAKSGGSNPQGPPAQNARRALEALVHCLPPAAEDSLQSLANFYLAHSPLKQAALEALKRRRGNRN